MGTQRHIMIALVLLSIVTSSVSAVPLPAAHRGLLPSPDVNVTATANVSVDVASPRSPISEYLTSTFLGTVSTVRRKGSPPSPPPPPPPTQIAQTVVLRSRLLDYEGMYKLVVEAGWGISIGIYDETRPGWKHGVSTTSSASNACDDNWCGIEVLFQASIPSHLSHHAESLSASAFCSGVASAKETMAQDSHDQLGCVASVRNIGLFNETNVTVPITTVHEDEKSIWQTDLGGALMALGVVGVLLLCFCCCACGDGGGPAA